MRGVFDSVAGKYDLMNDLMSAGLHRLWKRFAVDATGVRAGHARARSRRRHRRPRAPVRRPRRADGRGRAHRHQRRDARRRPRQAAERGLSLPTVQCDAEKLPFPDRVLRLRRHRVRPAQRHAQGSRARRDAPRAEAGRRRGGARILARLGAARAGVRLVQLQRAAAARQARRRRRRELPLSRRIDPHAPGPGGARRR